MNAYLFFPPLQTLFSLVLIGIVLKGQFRSTVHRLFSLYLLAGAVWGVIIFGMRASPDVEYAYSWDRWLVPVAPIMAVLFYHFSVRYTAARVKRWLLPLLYIICFLFIPLAPTRLVLSGMQVESYGYAPTIGPIAPFWILLSYILPVMSLLLFIKSYMTSHNAEQRNRSAYIIAGIIITLVGGVFDVLPVLRLPLYPGTVIGHIVFALLTSVAVLKYHFLDIYIIIRMGTAYFLLSAILAALYVGIIFLITYAFEGVEVSRWVYLLIIFLLALALPPLWVLVQSQVDKWFYRKRYDYLRALERFSMETQSIAGARQLNNTFVQLVSQAMQTPDCHLLLCSPVTGDFTMESSSKPGNPVPQLRLDRDSPIVQYLRRNDGLIHREDMALVPQLQVLTVPQMERLREIDGELYVPLKSQGKLIGIIILGRKISRRPYSLEEERLLVTIANQMAINLENARLYEIEKEERGRVEALQEQRNDFIMAMSHELRTPLTSIKLFSEMLAEETKVLPESPEGKLVKNLHLSANNMEKRVADLLDFLRLQTSSLEFTPKAEYVKEVIQDTISSLTYLISAKRQTLTVEIPDSLPEVVMDRQRFKQIIFNLLSNANRYIPIGGIIELKAKMIGDELVIEVKDNGPGIPLDEQALVFQPYYRVKKRSDHSLGLGLSIAKSLVELHGGRIWLDSQPGKGSTFSFAIPAGGPRGKEK